MQAPGLYPAQAPRATESRAEVAVHGALARRLPKGWYAWHSLRLRDRHNIDAEGDFVVVDPARGLLVLEVKGGAIEQRDGRWLQNGRPMKHDPRAQALAFGTKLQQALNDAGAEMPAWCVATCFADTPFENRPSQGDLRDAVLGQQDLEWLGEALAQVMSRGLPETRRVPERTLEALHRLWGETWVPQVSLGRKAVLQARDRVRLDAEQLAFLDSIDGNDRVLLTGCAGSGKTLLAAEAARRAAAAGKRTLLLCFTEPLALHLRRELEGTGVRVEAVRRYAADILRAAGITPPAAGPVPGANPAPDAARDPNAPTWSDVSIYAADHLRDRYDAVILDEGQDFGPNDWLLVNELAKHGSLWAFVDAAQAFWAQREIDTDLFSTRLKLPRPYRTPPALWRVAAACGNGDPAPDAVKAALETKELQLVPCPTASAAAEKVVSVVKVLRGEGLLPSDIAVISLRGQTADSPAVRALRASGIDPVRADDPDAADGLIADTFLRFKGLERPAVILTDLELVRDKREVRLHIALTRALTTAVVVASRDALRAEPVLSAGLGE